MEEDLKYEFNSYIYRNHAHENMVSVKQAKVKLNLPTRRQPNFTLQSNISLPKAISLARKGKFN